MNWRTWVPEQLRTWPALTALVSGRSMYSSGSLTGRPSMLPFLIIQLAGEYPGPYPGAAEQELDVHVHDEPGDLMAIDEILTQVRLALMNGEDVMTGQVVTLDGVACVWRGDSRDFADDGFKTVYKTAFFTLYGRKTHG